MRRVLAVLTDNAYAPAQGWTDVELWPSIAAAKESLLQRYQLGYLYKVKVSYADGTADWVLWPLLSSEATLTLYGAPKVLNEDTVTDAVFSAGAVPFRQLSLGPRGGVKEEKL